MSELVQVKHSDLPEGWSPNSADFINRVYYLNNLVYTKKTVISIRISWLRRT